MNEEVTNAGMLSPYRVLDLTDEKGLFCGKLLGDLGADVIKIERPGGDASRSRGPFYHDDIDPEKSLFWFALNSSKRGITLNIETADGQEILRKLVKTADFSIESFPPGYMEKLGLGYADLEKLNPRIIMVSITPFGQTGPYRDYRAPDIVAWALGQHMHPHGDADRAPVRVSYGHQAYFQAGANAAVAALMALYYRRITGEGQHVDISMQETIARLTVTADWDQNQVSVQRGVARANAAGNVIRGSWVWPCKDGHVVWFYWGGPLGMLINGPLLQWMESEGMLDDSLKEMDWEAFSYQTTCQEEIDRIVEPTKRFFMAHTKAELFEGAIKHQAMLYPINTVKDILGSEQLVAREYWQQVEHPELGASITYPGSFIKSSEIAPRIRWRAPLIGEHNRDVYEKELGVSREEMLTLKQAGII